MNTGRVDNPFQAPAARVADSRGDVAITGTLRLEPRRVSASEALGWLGRGWDLFKESPGAWIGLFVVFIVLMLVVSLIPLLGMVVGLMYPIMVGGIMIGCRSLDTGGGLRLGHLFAGFREEPAKLFLVGIINFAIGIGLTLLMGLIIFGAAGAAAAFGPDLASGGIGAVTGGVLVGMLVILALSLPLTMAAWFAPALVALHGTPPLEAMKLSFRGCLRNTVPFLAYGVVLFFLTVLGVLPLGLGLLVVVPMAWASIYYGYLDIFVG